MADLEYSRRFGSDFPSETFQIQTFEDISIDTSQQDLQDILKIKSYLRNGDVKSAYYMMNPEIEPGTGYRYHDTRFDKYMITTSFLNLLEEEIHNLQVYVKKNLQSSETSGDPVEGDIWIE